MMGNSFGKLFQITTWGESHGTALGVVIDGCPSNISLTTTHIQQELDRRKPGQNDLVTPRAESDQISILSGVYQDKTLGTPISLFIANKDANPSEYKEIQNKYRPSHADYTYHKKFNTPILSGGGRASARETATRVAAGAVAKQLLRSFNIDVVAWVDSVRHIQASVNTDHVSREHVDATTVRCPDSSVSQQMIDYISTIKKQKDSVGGVIKAVIRGVPAGIGNPVFDKLDADLAKALMSIPAAKAIAIGEGYQSTQMLGSEHNDILYYKDDKVRTKTNHAGGIVGGISNGESIIISVGFKPPSSIGKTQPTIDLDNNETSLTFQGRHDPCVLPRAVPVVEAMIQLVLTDHLLRQQCNTTF